MKDKTSWKMEYHEVDLKEKNLERTPSLDNIFDIIFKQIEDEYATSES